MNVLQMGSLAILFKWILLGTGIIIGLIFIRIWLQRSLSKEISKKVFDLLTNGLFLLVLVWKGSLLILEPKIVMKSPFSLLYFTGGEKGLAIAFLITIVYFIYMARKLISKNVIIQILLIFSLIVTSSYHFLFLFFLEDNELLHLLMGSIASVFLYLFLKRNKKAVS